jgi:hypothetical protein
MTPAGRRRRRRRLRVRAPGHTTREGYGSQHQKLRRLAISAWQPGDPCTRCGKPMWGPPSTIHLGHTDDKSGYRGLEHAHCNTSDGARRGNRTRRMRTTVTAERKVRPSRAWLPVTIRNHGPGNPGSARPFPALRRGLGRRENRTYGDVPF